MERLRRHETGVTLVETLLAMSILMLAIMATTSILLVGQSSSRILLHWTDQTQNLRAASRQIADDLAYAEWRNIVSNPPSFTVVGYAQRVSKTSGWNGLPEWPGDLMEWPQVSITYRLEGDSLVREVRDGARLTSRRIVAARLIPNDQPNGSYFKLDQAVPNLLKVRLTTLREQTKGEKAVAQVYSEFYVPAPYLPGHEWEE